MKTNFLKLGLNMLSSLFFPKLLFCLIDFNKFELRLIQFKNKIVHVYNKLCIKRYEVLFSAVYQFLWQLIC